MSAVLCSDDRWAVQQLLNSYAHHFDSGDFDAFAELFANGTLHLRGVWQPAHGVAEVREMLDTRVILYDGSPRTNHLLHNSLVEPGDDGRTARARTYVQVLQGVEDFPIQTIATGVYHDLLTRRDDGTWEFTERTAEGSLAGDLSRHLRSRRDR